MVDLTLETFEPLKGETFTVLAFGGLGEDGVEYPHAEIAVTLEAVQKGDPICYPDTYARDDKGMIMVDADGEKTVLRKGDPVPNMPTPFTLVFHAADHAPIWDGVYAVKHEKLGEIGELSLTRDLVTKDGTVRCMDGGKHVEIDGKVIDQDCCVLHARVA